MPFVKANDKFSGQLTNGYTVGQTTLYVSAVPDNVPTVIVADLGGANETVFQVTGKTTNTLTGVSRLRGANVDLDATTSITCVNNEDFINQFTGAVSSADTLDNIIYAEDGGSTDAYAITLDPAPSAYDTGLLVVFKPNTKNTGAATLNVNSLGAKTIKKYGDQDLNDGDLVSGQVCIVVYDGTNFQLQNPAREIVFVECPVVAGASDINTGDGKFYFVVPPKLNGTNLVYVHGREITAGTTGTTDIQVANVTDSVDMLSTKLTIDSGETDSNTAATPAVIDTSKDDVVTRDLLRIDIDATASTKAKGLIVTLGFQLP